LVARRRLGQHIGSIYPAGKMQEYLDLKAQGEFDNANWPDGCTGIVPKAARAVLLRGAQVGKLGAN
jgi:hypothetical protein